MKKFAVIGNPINHSLSPLMHESIFKQIGLKASYEKIQIEPFELEKFVRSNKLDGYNVTIPYKNIILKHLGNIGNSAQNITAVNCVSINKGYNTDWIGFTKTLDQNKIDLKNKSCLIIGSGGAAYAIAYALIRSKVSSIQIENRSIENKIKLEKWISQRMNKKSDSMPEVFINCTPLGMSPFIDEIPSNVNIKNGNIVIDTIYNPIKTKWLKQCEKKGAKIISGLDMLIAQGIASLNIWLEDDLFDKINLKHIKNILENELCLQK